MKYANIMVVNGERIYQRGEKAGSSSPSRREEPGSDERSGIYKAITCEGTSVKQSVAPNVLSARCSWRS